MKGQDKNTYESKDSEEKKKELLTSKKPLKSGQRLLND